MKKLLLEIRMYIAKVLLGWAFSIAPINNEGDNLKKSVKMYFESALNLSLVKLKLEK